MNKRFVKNKKADIKHRFEKAKKDLCDEIKKGGEGQLTQEYCSIVDKYIESLKIGSVNWCTDIHWYICYVIARDVDYNESFSEAIKGLEKKIRTAAYCYRRADCLADASPIDIEGDIVITDPCYTVKEENWCDFCHQIYTGEEYNYDVQPLPGGLVRDTIYGDWGCTTYDTDTKEVLGGFCADAGLVCVDTLERVLERIPDFLTECGKHCRTIIPNFKGKVWFKVVQLKKEAKGEFDPWNYEVRVMGDGINTETGEPIKFSTTQTSL